MNLYLLFMEIVIVLSTGTTSQFGGERALIGVEFASDAGMHFGYIDIDAGPGYAGITLYGWAYESEPGVPVIAALAPEPSSATLLLLGGAGLLARKRHRRCPPEI